MELVSLKDTQKALKKSKSWTKESIRESMIQSINKDLNRANSRLVKYGKDGKNYVILTYANKQVVSASIDITKIKDELVVLKDYLAKGKCDKAIEEFMETDDYKNYVERMKNIKNTKGKK